MNTFTLFTPHTGLFARRDGLAPGRSVEFGLRSITGRLLLVLSLALAGLLSPAVQAQEDPADAVQRVNINTADAEQLSAMLQGVGRARAEAIVQHREMFGPFEAIDELTDVSGLGEATLARNRELITLE